MRKYLVAASTAALLAASGSAIAQGVEPGFYVGVRAGVNLLQDSDVSGGLRGSVGYDTGYVGAGVIGYDFGGPRLEFEGGYRSNDVDSRIGATKISGDATAIYGMLNALYAFDLGGGLVPYIGVGAGVAGVKNELTGTGLRVDDTDTQFAYQGILGLGYHFDANWSVSADYRYFATLDPTFDGVAGNQRFSYDSEYKSHAFMLGVTYKFYEAAPVAPPPPPPPAQQARSFLVFFDFNQATITPEANRIINEAADAFQRGGFARIVLTGHTDRSGSPQYNQRLSLRRAEAVRGVLARRGIQNNSIQVIGRGESAPLVPTADGVREPQNRRVEIVFN